MYHQESLGSAVEIAVAQGLLVARLDITHIIIWQRRRPQGEPCQDTAGFPLGKQVLQRLQEII